MATLKGNKFMARSSPLARSLKHLSVYDPTHSRVTFLLQLSVVGLDYACQLVAEVCDETAGAPVVGEGGGWAGEGPLTSPFRSCITRSAA